MRKNDKNYAILTLNDVFKLQMSCVVRYAHYSLMILGLNRFPLVDFFRSKAKESLANADLAGEHIPGLGRHPQIIPISTKESNQHNVNEILKETIEHENKIIIFITITK